MTLLRTTRLAALLWTLVAALLSSSAQNLVLPSSPPAETRLFPVADIRPGQRGVAYTVFQGVLPEPMEVEILGVLKNSLGPNRDLILARLHGNKAEYTGVVAGMSGSPVYIDGKLLGALSFRIGQFSKEPIAGITPIAEMLDVADASPATLPEKASGNKDLQPISTPLLFSGFSQETLDRFGERFRVLGLTPVAGLGGSSPDTAQPEPLIPGSAVSAVFVRGDLSMAGTCTVTYVDASRLLACGHPITQAGPISMPMTKTAVVATLASPLNAFKIVNTTETVGSFTQDRAAAIAGRFGLDARMIPVAVEVSGTAKPSTVHFEVVDDKQITPNTMLVSVYQALQGTNGAAAEQSYRLSGTLSIAGQSPVTLAGVMAPNAFNTGAINAALYVGERFDRLYQNADEQAPTPASTSERPTVTGLQLHLEAIPGRRTAVLEAARLSRAEACPGDTLDLELTLHLYATAPVILHIPITLPSSLTPGPVRLLVSDGAALDRLVVPAPSPSHPLTLADTIAALNRAHTNDRLYVTLLDRSAQAVLQTGPLQQLPLSMVNVLDPLKETQQLQLTGESAVSLASAGTGYAVTASQVLRLLIR